ncbi:hypothetical protein N0V95_002802 [Ascochyta clinopodiicola]|nr:hypothetical protein N0V95_002802 [Ascochyta clinopodiicola]
MVYSIITAATLVALTAAAPTAMQSTKQAVDTSYGTYKDYGNYGKYGAYPGGVEKAAQAMGEAPIFSLACKDLSWLITSAANSNLKRDMVKTDVLPAAAAEYGSYGQYDKYTNYQTYPGDVEEAGVRMKTGTAQ